MWSGFVCSLKVDVAVGASAEIGFGSVTTLKSYPGKGIGKERNSRIGSKEPFSRQRKNNVQRP